jgi:hypothetical protein
MPRSQFDGTNLGTLGTTVGTFLMRRFGPTAWETELRMAALMQEERLPLFAPSAQLL